jgi:hypothetical protein
VTRVLPEDGAVWTKITFLFNGKSDPIVVEIIIIIIIIRRRRRRRRRRRIAATVYSLGTLFQEYM